jgi:dihydrofolate reductase
MENKLKIFQLQYERRVNMRAIVAVDKNWGIGNNGNLLYKIPHDLKRFKKLTTGKVVVMGRKTLESFPNGNPLPNRTNIVMTSNKSFDAKYKEYDNVIIVHNDDELQKEISHHTPDDVFLIGGGTMYNAYIDQCTEALVTFVDEEFEHDTEFPNLYNRKNWIWSEKTDLKSDSDCIPDFSFITFANIDLNSSGLRMSGHVKALNDFI